MTWHSLASPWQSKYQTEARGYNTCAGPVRSCSALAVRNVPLALKLAAVRNSGRQCVLCLSRASCGDCTPLHNTCAICGCWNDYHDIARLLCCVRGMQSDSLQPSGEQVQGSTSGPPQALRHSRCVTLMRCDSQRLRCHMRARTHAITMRERRHSHASFFQRPAG